MASAVLAVSKAMAVYSRVIRMVVVSRNVLGSVVRLGMMVVAVMVEMAGVVWNICAFTRIDVAVVLMVAVLYCSMGPPHRMAVLATALSVHVGSTVMRITSLTIKWFVVEMEPAAGRHVLVQVWENMRR